MLSYGLKIAWACLSLTGLVGCWTVLLAFSRAVESYWGAILYCLGCSILQISFFIGLAWKMDPFLMPKGFCIAQTVLIGFSAFLMTGVLSAFSLSTCLAVLKPARWVEANSRPLAWRHIYFLPIVVFPLLATVAQITVILKLDAVQPTDDLHCDASNPIWVRFLGYAGVPMILGLPTAVISAATIYSMCTMQGESRATNRDSNASPLTSLPRRRSRNLLYANARVVPTPSPTSAPPMSPSRAPIRPGFASPVLSARQFHLPFSPPPTLHRHPDMSNTSSRSSTSEEPDSPVSSSFPTFSPGEIVGHKEPVDNAGFLRADVHTPYEFHDHTNVDDWRELRNRVDSPAATNKSDTDRLSSLRWARQAEDDELRRSKSDFGFDNPDARDNTRNEEFDDDGEEGFVIVGDPRDHNWAQRPYRSQDSPTQMSYRATATNLSPAIWRLIFFQLLFTLILLLASISTIIDVAAGKQQPTPFGTQHVAQLLSAWGPVLYFGLLPSVRHNLYQMFSFKPS